MTAVCDEADEIVDLFSRKRPLALRVVDPATVLDEISDALDSVGAAERGIVRLRKAEATLGEQLHAFLRLEVALGHALDMIAGAEEAGVHIGFEMQLSTTEFAELLGRVRGQLGELRIILDDLDEPPPLIAGGLRADMVGSASGTQVRLRWAPPAGARRPAAVRLYSRRNVADIRRAAQAAYGCAGKALAEAERLALDATAALTEDPMLVVELPPGRSGATVELADEPLAAPVYEVATVNAFGVETPGPRAAATHVPMALAGTPWVAAASLAPPAGVDDFYRLFDAVEVRWEPSPNDAQTSAARARYAAEHGSAVVDHYRITRVEGERPTRVVRLSPGTRRWVDRPPVESLAQGVRYVVETVGANGTSVRPPEDCALTRPVAVDLQPAIERARSGLSAVRHPTGVERAARARLEDAVELRSRKQAFSGQAPDVQRQQIELWWSSQPSARREAWLAGWPRLVTEGQRQEWLDATPASLSARDLTIARIEVWMAEQPPEVQYEVERWWRLLDAQARQAATRRWRGTLNVAHREWLDVRLASVDPETEHRLLRGARILAWWDARDRRERESLERWWLGKPVDEQHHAVGVWLRTLEQEARVAVRWPDASQLTAAERQRRLEATPAPVPERLWPDLLAWLEWHALAEAGGEAFDDAIAAEVGGFGRLLIALRYATRPLDAAIQFRLPIVAPLLLVMLSVGVVLLLRLRRRRQQIVVPSGE
jgi:hypothetical protein